MEVFTLQLELYLYPTLALNRPGNGRAKALCNETIREVEFDGDSAKICHYHSEICNDWDHINFLK